MTMSTGKNIIKYSYFGTILWTREGWRARPDGSSRREHTNKIKVFVSFEVFKDYTDNIRTWNYYCEVLLIIVISLSGFCPRQLLGNSDTQYIK